MTNYSGVVRKIFPKSAWGTQSFVIDSVDKTYFNLGRKEPSFSEGQTVQFEGKPAKRPGNVDVVGDVQVTNETPVTSEDYSMASGARRSAEVMTKDNYWKNREDNDLKVQKVIQIQAARNAAIALYSAMEEVDVSPEQFINEWTDIFLKNNEDRLNG